jgi:hypothetical protein
MNLQELWKSKRFWLTIASVAVVVLKDKLPIGLSDEQIQQIVLAIGAWIVGDSLRGVNPDGK